MLPTSSPGNKEPGRLLHLQSQQGQKLSYWSHMRGDDWNKWFLFPLLLLCTTVPSLQPGALWAGALSRGAGWGQVAVVGAHEEPH